MTDIQASNHRESRCLSWANIALGALIPLMIGVGTVVITVIQLRIDDARRQQDRDLAYLIRMQDRDLANLTRMQDQNLAELTRMQDREFEEKRRHQDQQQVDELHYQDIYKTYLEDLSVAIFKQPNGSLFFDSETRQSYLRSTTLTALDEVDYQRRTRIFLFLYENKLLPFFPSDKSPIDLSGANLVNITVKATTYRAILFSSLSLPSVDLTNSSLIGCRFENGVNFNDSLMANTNFTHSYFNNYAADIQSYFHRTILTGADFHAVYLGLANFQDADLAYANLSGAFPSEVTMTRTNLIFADLRFGGSGGSPALTIMNSNMTGAILGFRFMEASKLNNVVLPNGTWLVDENNLFENGNAERWCELSGLQVDLAPRSSRASYSDPPITFTNQSNSCYFNMTAANSRPVEMSRGFDLKDYSLFTESGKAFLDVSADILCASNGLEIEVTWFWGRMMHFVNNNTQESVGWRKWTNTGNVPVLHGSTYLYIHVSQREQNVPCYIDNIEVHIHQGENIK